MSLNLRSVFHIAANDQRILWRELNSTRFLSLRTIISVGALFAIIQLPAWAVMAKMVRLAHYPSVVYLSLGWLCIGLLMVSGCMTRVPMALYDEKDLQLLLSSPLAPGTVIGARLISIALSCFLPAGILVVPVTNALVFHFGPRFAAGYLLWPIMSVTAAAIATIFVVTLNRSFGMKAGRIFAHSLPALVVAMPGGVTTLKIIFPGINVANMLAPLAEIPALSILGRAAEGGLFEIGASLVLLIVSWTYATVVMERAFLIGVRNAGSVRERHRPKSHRWREGYMRTYVLKDLRLLIRHPQLHGQAFSHAFLILLTAPVLIKLWGWSASIPLAMFSVGSIALELAYDSVEAEVAWEFAIQSAVAEWQLRAMKAVACSLFPLGVLVIYSVWIAITITPMVGAVIGITGALMAAASTWLVLGKVSFLTRRTLTRWRAPRSLRTYTISLGLAVLAAAPAMLLQSDRWVFALAAFILFCISIFGCYAGMHALGGSRTDRTVPPTRLA